MRPVWMLLIGTACHAGRTGAPGPGSPKAEFQPLHAEATTDVYLVHNSAARVLPGAQLSVSATRPWLGEYAITLPEVTDASGMQVSARVATLDEGQVTLAGTAHSVFWMDVQRTNLNSTQGAFSVCGLRLHIAEKTADPKIQVVDQMFLASADLCGFADAHDAQKVQGPPPDLDAFSATMLDRYTAAYPAYTFVTVGADGLQATRPGGETSQHGLRNLYNIVMATPWQAERDAEIERWVALFGDALAPDTTPPDSAATGEPDPAHAVVPMIKDSGTIAAILQQARELGYDADGPPIATERLAGDAHIIWALDLPDSFSMLNPQGLADLELDGEALRKKAAENVWARLDEVRLHRSGVGTPMMVTAGGNFEAALLLEPRVWATVETALGGPIVVATPARDLLLVCRASDATCVDAMRQQVVGYEQLSYPISSQLLVQRDGGWAVLPAEQAGDTANGPRE